MAILSEAGPSVQRCTTHLSGPRRTPLYRYPIAVFTCAAYAHQGPIPYGRGADVSYPIEIRSKRQAPLGNLTHLLFYAAVVYAVLSATVRAQLPDEYQIKAALLYNFAKFIEWPSRAFPDSGAPFLLGVVGDDRFSDILEETVKGKTVNGHRVLIRRLKGTQELKSCHILFISASERMRLGQILEGTKGMSILTVGEIDRFIQMGGIINFTMEAHKIHFEINPDVAEHVRLKISSKLLTLAKIVRSDNRAGKE